MPATSPYLTDYWTNRDDLQFSDFRPALREIITEARTPLTVGVFGPWGSGKTSLMRMLYAEIERGNVPNRRAVWFTAWKYDRHDALWRAFILRVLDGLYPREGGDGPRSERPRLTNPTDPVQLVQIELLQRLEESVYAPVTWEELGRWTVDWLTLAQQAKDAGVELAEEFLPVPGIVKRLLKLAVGHKDEDSGGVSAAIGREVQQYHLAQLEHMEQFEDRFRQALKTILGDAGRLIVFVDDLDRCLPEKALEVLEAIKLFLEVEGAVFVLGMDQGVVKQGIETRYGALLRGDGRARTELPISGDAYLQKIVQVPFHLPPLAVEDMEGFIAALDADAPPGRALGPMTRAVLARGLLPNPRQVKRVLNIFRLLQTIALTREERGALEPESVAWPLLAKAVLIQTQFPGFYQEWRLRPTLVQALEEEYRRRPVDEEEILHGAARRRALAEDAADAAADDAAMPLPTRATPAPSGRGGLLDEYLSDRRKYALLEQMLAYPPPDEDGAGRARARFAGLDYSHVAVYVRLAGTAGDGTATPTAPPADLLAEMSSGDPAKMRDAVARLRATEPDGGPQSVALCRALLQLMQDRTQPAAVRCVAGEALDLLDTDDAFGPPGLDEFVPITLADGTTIRVGKYPVTNRQYARFVDAGGYAVREWWSDEGWERHEQEEWTAPRYWDNEEFNSGNKPVVTVSWYEANAYCAWLTEELRAVGTIGAVEEVRLPSEDEWMAAAHSDHGKEYPWGSDEFDQAHANTGESGLKRTTPVHMYPDGATPDGVWDLAGNVWEWTRDVDAGGVPWLRGGSWWNDASRVVASARHWAYPHGWAARIGVRVVVVPISR